MLIENKFKFEIPEKPIRLPIVNISQKVKQLKELGIPHQLHSSVLSKKLYVGNKLYTWYKKGGLNKSDLGFIRRVQKHCEAIDPKLIKPINRKGIAYLNKNNLNYAVYKKELWEIDLNSIYWHKAKKYLSEAIYKEGLKRKKKPRLIALGNLAKRPIVHTFDGIEYQKPVHLQAKITEHIFYNSALATDSILKKMSIIANENYLFYWVDALFFRGDKIKEIICEYLVSENIPFKVVPILKIVSQRDYIEVRHWDEKKKDYKDRVFLFEGAVKSKKHIAKLKAAIEKVRIQREIDRAAEPVASEASRKPKLLYANDLFLSEGVKIENT